MRKKNYFFLSKLCSNPFDTSSPLKFAFSLHSALPPGGDMGWRIACPSAWWPLALGKRHQVLPATAVPALGECATPGGSARLCPWDAVLPQFTFPGAGGSLPAGFTGGWTRPGKHPIQAGFAASAPSRVPAAQKQLRRMWVPPRLPQLFWLPLFLQFREFCDTMCPQMCILYSIRGPLQG